MAWRGWYDQVVSAERFVSFVRLLKKPMGESRDVDDGPSGADGVRLAWELSQEQWALQRGHDPVQPGLQRSLVVLARR